MRVEIIKVCDYDRVIFNYFFLFRPISRFFFGLHLLKVDIVRHKVVGRTGERRYSLSEGGRICFYRPSITFLILFDHKGLL